MNAIYNEIGDSYDATRRADPNIVRILAELISLNENGMYLDVGCGTGNYTQRLASLGGTWTAFDQSQLMIEQAKQKNSNINWGVYDVISTPYEPASFDSIICTLAIHHFQDLPAAFAEISRILSSKGRFVIFTSSPEQMKLYWLNYYFPKMLECSIDQMPSISKIETALNEANLKLVDRIPYSITIELQDLFLYSGKQRPQMYLSETIRSGISSFRNFCSDSELNSGLSRLAADIQSGKINRVIEDYQSDQADYCFLVAEK
jgi:ubiquinone/menaquinone biosynthesis C-methylase UbiE